MRLIVEHVTTYTYDQPVRAVVQSHRLRPSEFDGQKRIVWNVEVSDGLKGGAFVDGAGDFIQAWTILGPVSRIEVTARGTIETRDLSGVLRGHREQVPPFAWLRETTITTPDVALRDLAQSVTAANSLGLAHALAEAIADAITYTAGATTAQTTAAEALALGEGVCQDHAHAMIACARLRDLPARYVSGYLFAKHAEHNAAHAWAEVWVDGLGWVGFDPANRCCPDARYIRLGSGMDAQDAAPIRGVARGNGEEAMEIAVAIAAAQQ